MLLSAKPTITFSLSQPDQRRRCECGAFGAAAPSNSTRSNWPVPPTPSSRIPGSDSKLAADLLVVEHMRLLGRLAHLFDGDRI